MIYSTYIKGVNVEEEKRKEIRTIVYIGNDKKYWDALKQRFNGQYAREESNFKFEFLTMWSFKESDFYGLFLRLLEIDPKIIYIDVTERTDQLLDIGQLISQDDKFRSIPIVGLIESQDMIHQCRSAGLSFTHIKCPEYHDVVYDPMCVAYPQDVIKPDFAEARFSRDVELIVDFKILSISATSMHVEGNIRLEKGQIIDLQSDLPKNIVPSSRFIVKQIYNKNLFYDCMYGYDFDFIFLDEPVFDEDGIEIKKCKKEKEEKKEKKEDKKEEKKEKEKEKEEEKPDPKVIEKMKKERIAEYQGELLQIKKRHKEWVLDHMDDYKFPKTKILLVDRDMSVLRNQSESLENHPYIFRTQTFLTDDLWIIDKIRPDIIAFKYSVDDADEFDSGAEGDDGENEADDSSSSSSQLLRLIDKLKEEERYMPFVVVFNCSSYNSDSFRNTFGYNKVLVIREKMGLKFVVEMAKMHQIKNEKKYNELVRAKIQQLKKENPSKYRNLNPSDFEEQKYDIRKNHKLSYAEARYKISLMTMTESEITFEVDTPLEMKTYRLDFPTPLSINIIPDDVKSAAGASSGDEENYRALIHSVDEDKKKKIRLYVNEIFFQEVNAKRSAELQEFERIREDAKKQQKIEDGFIPEDKISDEDEDESDVITFDDVDDE